MLKAQLQSGAQSSNTTLRAGSELRNAMEQERQRK
jgi:hypothetical protein